jgi:hypothetical protein
VDLEILGSGIKLRVIFFPTNCSTSVWKGCLIHCISHG